MQKNVLLVDDESSIRHSLSIGLNQEGYDVEPCENAIDALKKFELYTNNNMSFDVAVIDIRLPDIDGIQLGKIIQTKYPNVVIVFITGYASEININDMEEIKKKSIIEKPFTISDLTTQFKNLSVVEAVDSKSTSNISKLDSKVISKYALLKLNKESDFITIYRKLYFMENVLYCDATMGEYDIFILMQEIKNTGKSLSEFEKYLREMKEIKEIDILEVSTPVLDENTLNVIQAVEDVKDKDHTIIKGRDFSKHVCSYILMDVDREKIDKVYPKLRLNDNVVYCDYTTGKYNFVLFLHATTFTEIEKIIDENINNLEGILKMKKYSVVNLFEM